MQNKLLEMFIQKFDKATHQIVLDRGELVSPFLDVGQTSNFQMLGIKLTTTRRSKSNPIELNFNRTQSNSIELNRWIEFD